MIGEWTDKTSTLEVRFTDETILAQGPNSKLFLDDFIYSSDPSISNLPFQMGGGTFRYISVREKGTAALSAFSF
tara:strand:- start:313 stop:534 length:222 start_codon:yes stop_codon:yes gene_type:complete